MKQKPNIKHLGYYGYRPNANMTPPPKDNTQFIIGIYIMAVALLLISMISKAQCPAGKVYLPSQTNTHCILVADTCVSQAVYDRVTKWCSGEVQHNSRRIDLKNLKRDYPMKQWNNAKDGEFVTDTCIYYKLNYEFVGFHNGKDNGLWIWDEKKFKAAVKAALEKSELLEAKVALNQMKDFEAFKVSFRVYVQKRLKL